MDQEPTGRTSSELISMAQELARVRLRQQDLEAAVHDLRNRAMAIAIRLEAYAKRAPTGNGIRSGDVGEEPED